MLFLMYIFCSWCNCLRKILLMSRQGKSKWLWIMIDGSQQKHEKHIFQLQLLLLLHARKENYYCPSNVPAVSFSIWWAYFCDYNINVRSTFWTGDKLPDNTVSCEKNMPLPLTCHCICWFWIYFSNVAVFTNFSLYFSSV